MEARCLICEQEYNHERKLPRIVPECGHTFCEQCISEGNRNIFVCPIDNSTHNFKNGQNDLPRNMVLFRAMNNKKSAESGQRRQPKQTNQFLTPNKVHINDMGKNFKSRLTCQDTNVLSRQQTLITKAIQDGIEAINKHILNRIESKFKVYYQTIKKYQIFFINQVNKLKDYYRTILFTFKTQLTKQIQNSDKLLCKRIDSLKQSIDQKMQSIQLLSITQSSIFIKSLFMQDTQTKSTINKSQVRFQQNDNSNIQEENLLSIHSKPDYPRNHQQHQNKLVSDFKVFVQNRSRNPSLITTNSKFSPNLKKPMKLLKQSNREDSKIFNSYEYYDMGTVHSVSPRKKIANLSNRSYSSEKDKLEDRRRIDDILLTVSENRTPSLQLINMNIKDSYMRSIGESIARNTRKIGLLKLVKNLITDKGLQLLLIQLYDYTYMHTLNLTSNYLTDASLDVILQFSKNNKMLTNFYVGNNSMTVPKGYRMLLNQSGINVFL